MLTATEIDRLAAAGNALRPDWTTADLRAFIGAHLPGSTYRDAAHALVYVGTDPNIPNPSCLRNPGPWWPGPVRPEASGPISGKRIPCPHHPNEPAGRCQPCKAQRATPEQIAAARQRARELAANPPEETP